MQKRFSWDVSAARYGELYRAAVDGTAEVGPAVTASTLTTVAVFLPIVFVEGIAGQLFKDQALTVTISLIASLIVAITIIPMLSALGARLGIGGSRVADDTRARESGIMDTETALTLGRFSRGYDRLVRGAIARRWVTLVVAFGLFFVSMASVSLLEIEPMTVCTPSPTMYSAAVVASSVF